jgi:hypothetical protein
VADARCSNAVADNVAISLQVQLIADAALLPLFWFILKETRGDVILARRAKGLRKQGRNAFAKSELNKSSVAEMLKVSFKRPTKMLITEFVVVSFTLWVSFAWGILFLFQSSVAQVFSRPVWSSSRSPPAPSSAQ